MNNYNNQYVINDLNQKLERIIALYDSKGDPNVLLNQMVNSSVIPQFKELEMQFNNMTQGKDRKSAYIELAQEYGISQRNIEGLKRILGVN